MNKEVKAHKTLLVNGPAAVRLVSGEAEILGAPLNMKETIVIRNGKRIPFYVKKAASFDITLGKDSIVEEADGNTVPVSWQEAAEEILSLEKPIVVMIMGGADSGKTSLCTFLANKALRANSTLAIIDADLGQSDIGPPTTIGLAYINKPIKDLYHVKADDVCFIGSTSPRGAEKHVINCIAELKKRVLERGKDFLVINTDGWVDGDDAVQYKIMLAETVAPNAVVGIEQEKELTPILSKLKIAQVFTVNPSTAVRKRDRERRKTLRELGYKKYLKKAKVEAFSLNWIKIEEIHSSSRLFLASKRLEKIEETLETQTLYCEETGEAIWIVLKPSQRVDVKRWHKAEKHFKKKIKVMHRGNEKGLIVGLHDEENRFLGLGVIFGIDFRKKIVKVFTPVNRNVATIQVGKVKLDDACREIGARASLWTNLQPA